MKKNYFLNFALLSTFLVGSAVNATAQLKVAPGNPVILNDLNAVKKTNHVAKAVSACGADTVQYPLAKATSLAALNINNATSASAAGQYYNAPDTITVRGMDFYAWKSNTMNGTTLVVNAEIYLAGSDSLPTGLPLASQVITIDTTFNGGSLATLKKSISFPSPVVVTQPYVLVVSNNSPNPMSLLSNSYSAGNGAMEDLSSLRLGATYTKGSNVNVGGTPFDADFLLHPHVTYDLKTDFILNPDSLYSVPTTVAVTNNSTPLLFDRMYNIAALAQFPSNTYDFGNGGGTAQVVDSNVTYNTLQNYTITLTDTLFQYNGNNCISTESKVLAVGIATGINDSQLKNIKFSLNPNPVKNSLVVESPIINERLFIFSIDGKLIEEQMILTNRTVLNTSELTNGIYFVKIGNTSKKLIVNK